jgi:hypothetical protein
LISALLPIGIRAVSLGEVKSVYLMPMSNGLDQYLADRLTHDHVLQVVTDPKAADAMITDRLGDSFQQQLFKLRPELKPLPPPKPAKKKDAAKDGDKDSAKDEDKDSDKDEKKDEDMQVISSFHAARGTVFLVHARTQQVVWSTYEKPGSHDPKSMERTASKIAKLLEKELAPSAAAPARK